MVVYHVLEALDKRLLVIKKAVQLTANGASLVNGEDARKRVVKEYKLGPGEWYNLQGLVERYVQDILPSQGLVTWKYAQWIVPGVIIAYGAHVAKHAA